ncbi:MAG: DUF445 family protein [Chitinophagaceae bacterium]|nr:DUF445 family protein [Chitinophagaceae bacterium]
MIYILPIISAFIGWFTNYIAIKMLFHPKIEKNILGLKFQGIFPKRQKQFAEKLGTLVSKELISFKDIESKIISPENLNTIMPLIDEKMEIFLSQKLSKEMPVLSMFISNDTVSKIKTVLIKDIEEFLPEVMLKLSKNIEQKLDIEHLVVQKVSNFSSDKLESILQAIMQKEFRFIEIIGAVLGFLIGILQLIISQLAT